ncbi:MAG: hypothetical protein QNJ60_00260 [Xenococcaceae cyanobacterium MO_188.B19]|nr:hypothetical protein [Xenococcaceae cyanobacterium MO_188.B19]
MNNKILGHYSLGFSLPFLKKLIVENQIFLQTFTVNKPLISNDKDCNSIILFPKLTSGFTQMFRGSNQGSLSDLICHTSAEINILFVLAFVICFGLFFFLRGQQDSIEIAIIPMIIFIIIAALIKMLEILIYGF